MDNNDFNIRIIDFYKDVDKPIINNLVNNDSFKNILALSTISEIPLLKKNKNTWNLKDKRILLKNIETSKKKKIKEIKNNISNIHTIKITDIKEYNNKLFTDLEQIDILKNNIENDEIYNNLKKLSLLYNGYDLTKKKGGFNSSINIVNIEEKPNLISSDTSDFIEIFSN